MPRLVKGGKWVFGWALVSLNNRIRIPPDAFLEYGFEPGEMVLVFWGSRSSGGFSLGKLDQLENTPLQTRSIGQERIGDHGLVTLLPGVGIRPGERLLVVRGSGLALGFIRCGPIYEEALKHTEIEMFMVDEYVHNTMPD
jgi:hypothetical protein